VSVGEVKGAQPVVRGLEEAFPGLEVVVSATTATGFEQAQRLFPASTIVRFPFDPAFLVRRFLRRVDPVLVVLIELEIWPNFLRECNRRGVPVAVVNGRITDRSRGRYRLFGRLLRPFERISLFCAQSEEYAERFLGLGVDPRRVRITGNIKADGLDVGPVEPGPELVRLLGAPQGRACLVAGSTHEPEELALVRAWRRGAPEARLILVPRHPGRCGELVASLRGELGVPPQLLTRLRAGGEEPDPARPALVDTIGELEAVYALADLVFVGGSLVPHGGKNVLEPAAREKPVLVGPHVGNFRQESRLLRAAGASLQVADEQELAGVLRELLADAPRRAAMGRAGRAVVERQKGATRRTLAALEGLEPGRLATRPTGSAEAEAGERS